MTTFDDRLTSFEAKFARDEEMAFRIIARRNRLLGVWAAEQMDLTPAETDAYCKAVVQADFEEAGDEDVIRKLLGDLRSEVPRHDDHEVGAFLGEPLRGMDGNPRARQELTVLEGVAVDREAHEVATDPAVVEQGVPLARRAVRDDDDLRSA